MGYRPFRLVRIPRMKALSLCSSKDSSYEGICGVGGWALSACKASAASHLFGFRSKGKRITVGGLWEGRVGGVLILPLPRW